MEMYFVLRADEDGGRLDVLTKEQLTERLNEDYYGSGATFVNKQLLHTLGKGRKETSINVNELPYDPDGLLIIKGEVVVPKERVKVTRYDI